MVHFTAAHQISCDVETYRQLYKSTKFNEDLYKDRMWFATIAVMAPTENDAEILRKSSGAPTANIPEPMKSFIGDNFGYTVDSRYSKATDVWTFTWTPNKNADVLALNGTVKVVPTGTGAVKCTADITFKADIFAIGGAIEAFLQYEFTEGWKAAAAFANQWLADGKPLT